MAVKSLYEIHIFGINVCNGKVTKTAAPFRHLFTPLLWVFAQSDDHRGYGAPLIYLQSFHNSYRLYFGGKGAALLDR